MCKTLRNKIRSRGVVWMFAIGAVAIGARAADHSMHMHHQQAANDKSGAIQLKLPDTVLSDQDGKALRFKSDAIGKQLVAINFIYTTCTTVCPVQSALFSAVQKRLAESGRGDVTLVSVTVDPLRDTPLVLKKFAARYDAKANWKFITGGAQAVEEVLKAFDVSSANYEDHPATTVVGDPLTGEWTRFFGFQTADRIVERIEDLRAARRSRS